ncbi:unnamed protein product [Calypogeia fissa]
MEDMYKRRTAGRIAQIRIPKKVLADFEEDGYTVVIPRRVDVVDLEADCRNRFVLSSESPEPQERAAIESSKSETVQEMGSAERSVLGDIKENTTEHSQSECSARDATSLSQGAQSRSGSTIRVVISRQQLAKLLAEGSIKKSSGCRALLPPSAAQNSGPLVGDMAQIISNAMKMTRSPGSPWSPGLDTITEAPQQLTRSPVITRNSEAVENFLQTKT